MTDAPDAELVGGELLDEVGRPAHRNAQQRGGEVLEGEAPGKRSVTSQPPEGTRPRSAGTSPAFTTDDLPIPEGPTTATSRCRRDRRHELVDERGAAVEVGGVALLEGLQALVRVAGRVSGLRERLRCGGPAQRLRERHEELVDGLVALAGVVRRGARDHLVERGRQLGPQAATDGSGRRPSAAGSR